MKTDLLKAKCISQNNEIFSQHALAYASSMLEIKHHPSQYVDLDNHWLPDKYHLKGV